MIRRLVMVAAVALAATAAAQTVPAEPPVGRGDFPRDLRLTRLDIFILGATILVFLGLVEVVASGNLAARERGVAARRLDRWSRLVFPVAFATVIALALWP